MSLEGIRLSKFLNLKDLNAWLTETIIKRMTKDDLIQAKDRNKTDFNLLDLVQEHNPELAQQFEALKMKKLSSNNFLKVVCNIKSTSYLIDIRKAVE